jgi:hypothetical protein
VNGWNKAPQSPGVRQKVLRMDTGVLEVTVARPDRGEKAFGADGLRAAPFFKTFGRSARVAHFGICVWGLNRNFNIGARLS